MHLKYEGRKIAILAAAALLAARQQSIADFSKPERTYVLTDEVAARISAAAPSKPVAKPRKARKVLVYGRMQTHPESVVCCFHAMKQISGII